MTDPLADARRRMAEECYQTCRVHSVDKHKMTTIDSALSTYARLAVEAERERLREGAKRAVLTCQDDVMRPEISQARKEEGDEPSSQDFWLGRVDGASFVLSVVLALLSPAKEGGR